MRRILRLVALLALAPATVLAIYAATRTTPPPTETTETAETTRPPTETISMTVADRWRPGTMQKGIHIYWENNPADSSETVAAKSSRILDYVVRLGANSVAVSFPIYTDGRTASAVAAGRGTPSPERIGILLEEATKRGLRTTLRPLLDEASLRKHGSWRGTIAPAKPARWFASYRDTLAPFLAVAEQHRANTVVIAAELSSMDTHDAAWRTLSAQARTVFRGELSVSRNWDLTMTPVPHYGVDAVGIDAYPPLDLPDSATAQRVRDAWGGWLRRAVAGQDPGAVVIHEVGLGAQTGAYRKPYRWGDPKLPLRLDMQATWFAAAFDAARELHLGGVYFWKLDFHADPSARTPDDGDRGVFVGRPAQDAIAAAFTPSR